MLKTLGTMAAVGLVAIGVSGCGSGGDDVVTNVCDKAQSCNALTGSLQECKDNLNKVLSNETSAARADTETSAKQCLAFQSCDNFVTCIKAL